LLDEKSDDMAASERHARGMEGVSIRPARLEELPFLDDLVVRSKSHWTGGRVQDVPPVTAKLTAEDITARHATVAEKHGVPIGFYTLNEHEHYLGIGLLFVDRPFIGTGVGRLLWSHLTQHAAAQGDAFASRSCLWIPGASS
jgi:Acetyltransferase (GNAT) domain